VVGAGENVFASQLGFITHDFLIKTAAVGNL
jgi:hypothetical protein